MSLLVWIAVAAMLQAEVQAVADRAQPDAHPPAAGAAKGEHQLAAPGTQPIPYDPNQIVTVGVPTGYAAVIELAADERVDVVVVGNSAVWQVTTNRRGDRVIVKALPGATRSNMVVLTDSRRYMFMLDPTGYMPTFVIRFSYPQPAHQASGPEAGAIVAMYRFRGDEALFPAAMRDDGQRTVITWGEQSALPAIFAMNDGRTEQLVNGRMVGNDFVIEGTAARYRFRLGNAEATAVRDGGSRSP